MQEQRRYLESFKKEIEERYMKSTINLSYVFPRNNDYYENQNLDQNDLVIGLMIKAKI